MDPKKSCGFPRDILSRRSWTLVSWGSWFAVGAIHWLMPPHSAMASVGVDLVILVGVVETGWMVRTILRPEGVQSP